MIEDMWPDRDARTRVDALVSQLLDEHIVDLPNRGVLTKLSATQIRGALSRYDFAVPRPLDAVARDAIELLANGMVPTMHPRYLGLFNPSVTFPGIVADRITATLNPQLAAWSHAPAAAEIELHTLKAIGALCGWTREETNGHFTSGGAEANNTAVLLALTRAHPDFADHGARAYSGQPRLYVSVESHLAWLKIAHQAGVGREAVRLIATDGAGAMLAEALERQIKADRTAGDIPVFIGATAGTTNAGMVDPLFDCRRIALAENMWLHVDAAWGGAALLSPRCRAALAGIEDADSITIDAHKWFAVPMGAGMFLCRDASLLRRVFHVATSYMPASTDEGRDPYSHSMQWSRRFIGLKLFLSLASIGLDGYRQHVERTLDLALRLSEGLAESGWEIVNDSVLGVVCFVRGDTPLPSEIAAEMTGSGEAWVSTTKFEGRDVLRACVTSHFTSEADIDRIIVALNRITTERLADSFDHA